MASSTKQKLYQCFHEIWKSESLLKSWWALHKIGTLSMSGNKQLSSKLKQAESADLSGSKQDD